MDPAASIASAWIGALARCDFEGLDAVLQPNVQFRALTPGESVSVASAIETIACFRRWFGDASDIVIIDQHAAMLVDRLSFRFSARVGRKGQTYLIEQNLWADVDDGKFAAIDLVCSGFRPEGVAATSESVHTFDAGDLGCGTGLPREFRARLMQIPVGHVLEVITADPSAKEDLPSLARMLGHQVRSVETGADRKHRIRVERST
jgi:TusA-related sulfurtransferase